MTSSSIFGSPMLVGFEPFEQMLEQVVKASTDGYPPYNIEKITEHHFRISLAVAGFIIEELEVEVETSQLKVTGRQEEKRKPFFPSSWDSHSTIPASICSCCRIRSDWVLA